MSTPYITSLPAQTGVTSVTSGSFPEPHPDSDRGKNLPLVGAKGPPPVEATREATANVNDWLKLQQHSVRLLLDPDSGDPIIHVVDKATGAVIRQIPNEEVIKLADWWEKHSMLNENRPVSLVVDERA